MGEALIEGEAGTRDVTYDLELWLVHAIEQLPGVLAASVWLTDLKRVRAVHITAAPSASGAIITKAAAQVLRRHGLDFRIDAIRVVFRDGTTTPSPDVTAAPAVPGGGRFLILDDLVLHRAGSRVTCQVRVTRGTELLEGEATELDTESGRIRAAARATLAAAERAGDNLALGLEGSIAIDLFGRRYVATSVEAAVDRRFATLSGLAPIDPARSVEEAACLAALRAIDRWIAW